ncbi:MAG: murein biosynthesis integral membrane protein MurJ [Qingshengfaniella sp.]
MKPIRLLRGFLTVGGWTMASRVLGFVRDAFIAVVLGSGPVAEAFLVAFSLPNMFRRFFAEGAFNMAFVPQYSKRVEAGDDPEGFAAEAFSGMLSVLILFALVGILAMPLLVTAMASGFIGDARFALATDMGRICFIYILFVSLAALLAGMLNAYGHFAAAAAAPVALNVILVAVLFAFGGTDGSATGPAAVRAGRALAWGVVCAGVAQCAILYVAARRAGIAPRLVRPRFTPRMRRLLVVATPAALAGGVVQVNLLVGRQVASFFEGAVAWLAYADRLYQLPLGVVGIAVGVVLLPDLSRRLAAGDAAGGRFALSRAGELSLALTIPAAVALVVIAEPLISVLFQRGAFDATDSAHTALAVAIYGAGLPAFVLQKVLQPVYFARENTRSPFRFALVAMGVNAGLAAGLAPVMGWSAAAIGTTLAAWAMVWQLWRGTREMGNVAHFDDRFRRRLPRLILASAVMGAALWIGALWLDGPLHSAGIRYGALATLIGIGAVVYFTAAHVTGGMPLGEFRAALRRKPR